MYNPDALLAPLETVFGPEPNTTDFSFDVSRIVSLFIVKRSWALLVGGNVHAPGGVKDW